MVMIELLRLQAQTQANTLTNCVLALARDPLAVEQVDACASAARMFEGTAHLVGMKEGAELARQMEECFTSIRRGDVELQQELIELMLQSVDLLDNMTKLSETTPSRPQTPAVKARRQPTTGNRILVIDDSMEILELARKLLTYRGYDVMTAGNGIDAWYALRHTMFDLVLTDVDMPLLDGPRLIRLIRKDPRLNHIPILIACDQGNAQQRWAGFDAGADYYVIKGTFHDSLVEAVRTLIARRSRDEDFITGPESDSF